MTRGYEEAALQPEHRRLTDPSRGVRPQDALFSDMELPLKRVFYPLGYPVEVATNEATVLEIADECFRHMRMLQIGPRLRVNIGVTEAGGAECPSEPTRREHNHLFSLVADVDNRALLDLNTCEFRLGNSGRRQKQAVLSL